MSRNKNRFLALSMLWFVIGVSQSVTIWTHVSTAAKIGLFATGMASGIFLGLWVAGRKADRG